MILLKESLMLKPIYQIMQQKPNSNLASLKTDKDKLDIDKLASAPVGLSKESDVVKMKLSKGLYMTK